MSSENNCQLHSFQKCACEMSSQRSTEIEEWKRGIESTDEEVRWAAEDSESECFICRDDY